MVSADEMTKPKKIGKKSGPEKPIGWVPSDQKPVSQMLLSCDPDVLRLCGWTMLHNELKRLGVQPCRGTLDDLVERLVTQNKAKLTKREDRCVFEKAATTEGSVWLCDLHPLAFTKQDDNAALADLAQEEGPAAAVAPARRRRRRGRPRRRGLVGIERYVSTVLYNKIIRFPAAAVRPRQIEYDR